MTAGARSGAGSRSTSGRGSSGNAPHRRLGGRHGDRKARRPRPRHTCRAQNALQRHCESPRQVSPTIPGSTDSTKTPTRTYPAIPAEGHRFPPLHDRTGPQHHGPTQQPATEMSWLQNSKSALLGINPPVVLTS